MAPRTGGCAGERDPVSPRRPGAAGSSAKGTSPALARGIAGPLPRDFDHGPCIARRPGRGPAAARRGMGAERCDVLRCRGNARRGRTCPRAARRGRSGSPSRRGRGVGAVDREARRPGAGRPAPRCQRGVVGVLRWRGRVRPGRTSREARRRRSGKPSGRGRGRRGCGSQGAQAGGRRPPAAVRAEPGLASCAGEAAPAPADRLPCGPTRAVRQTLAPQTGCRGCGSQGAQAAGRRPPAAVRAEPGLASCAGEAAPGPADRLPCGPTRAVRQTLWPRPGAAGPWIARRAGRGPAAARRGAGGARSCVLRWQGRARPGGSAPVRPDAGGPANPLAAAGGGGAVDREARRPRTGRRPPRCGRCPVLRPALARLRPPWVDRPPCGPTRAVRQTLGPRTGATGLWIARRAGRGPAAARCGASGARCCVLRWRGRPGRIDPPCGPTRAVRQTLAPRTGATGLWIARRAGRGPAAARCGGSGARSCVLRWRGRPGRIDPRAARRGQSGRPSRRRRGVGAVDRKARRPRAGGRPPRCGRCPVLRPALATPRPPRADLSPCSPMRAVRQTRAPQTGASGLWIARRAGRGPAAARRGAGGARSCVLRWGRRARPGRTCPRAARRGRSGRPPRRGRGVGAVDRKAHRARAGRRPPRGGCGAVWRPALAGPDSRPPRASRRRRPRRGTGGRVVRRAAVADVAATDHGTHGLRPGRRPCRCPAASARRPPFGRQEARARSGRVFLARSRQDRWPGSASGGSTPAAPAKGRPDVLSGPQRAARADASSSGDRGGPAPASAR